ncbi:hypothetical protein Dsin_028153 [Dipteronia sinensis]|uniref:Small auxin up regulated protein n=1 Tax=Dipteronia sinensis TaxID=43782 RepID=A0AAE0DV92_9ROSI|nr:hypothetical protein Dsin_028153 [Dipteronia sinensis]
MVIMARTYQYQLLIMAFLLCTPQMTQGSQYVPLKYLGKSVFRELLRMSDEEFGIPNNGLITLPCDSTFLKYVLALVRGGISEGLEKSANFLGNVPILCVFTWSITEQPSTNTYLQPLKKS